MPSVAMQRNFGRVNAAAVIARGNVVGAGFYPIDVARCGGRLLAHLGHLVVPLLSDQHRDALGLPAAFEALEQGGQYLEKFHAGSLFRLRKG